MFWSFRAISRVMGAPGRGTESIWTEEERRGARDIRAALMRAMAWARASQKPRHLLVAILLRDDAGNEFPWGGMLGGTAAR